MKNTVVTIQEAKKRGEKNHHADSLMIILWQN